MDTSHVVEKLSGEGLRRSLNLSLAKYMSGDVTRATLSAGTVDTILCLSVLQYLDDDEVRRCLRAFSAGLKSNGVLILHVKNLASLYLSTLWIAKQLLGVIGKNVKLEYFRTYRGTGKNLKAQVSKWSLIIRSTSS